jgi:L-asparaginase/Glu-tRNA(Gln) amidotransferase subunit D
MLHKLYLITTGGTAASTKYHTEIDTYYAPSMHGQDKLKRSLIQAVPNLHNLCDVNYIDLPAIDSKDINFNYIKNIYRNVVNIIYDVRKYNTDNNVEKIKCDILIVHGTDNIESTITFLALDLYLQKLLQQYNIAVILWGAMRTLDHSETPDGPDNFKTAFMYTLSANKQAGVFLAFNYIIQPAFLVRKKHTQSLATFDVEDAILKQYEKDTKLNTFCLNLDVDIDISKIYSQIVIVHNHMSLGALHNLNEEIKSTKNKTLRGIIFENRIFNHSDEHNYNNNNNHDINILYDTLKIAAENQVPIVLSQSNYLNIPQCILELMHQKHIIHNQYLTTEKTLVLMHMLLCSAQQNLHYYEAMQKLIICFDNFKPISKLSAYTTPYFIKNIRARINKWDKKYPILYIRNYIDMPDFIIKGILNDMNKNIIKGLVIEGTGNGTYQNCLEPVIELAQKYHLPVVRSSICKGFVDAIATEEIIASNGLSTYDCMNILNDGLQKGIVSKLGLQNYFKQF